MLAISTAGKGALSTIEQPFSPFSFSWWTANHFFSFSCHITQIPPFGGEHEIKEKRDGMNKACVTSARHVISWDWCFWGRTVLNIWFAFAQFLAAVQFSSIVDGFGSAGLHRWIPSTLTSSRFPISNTQLVLLYKKQKKNAILRPSGSW